MRVLSFDAELCVGCYICEEGCSETFFKETNEEKSRIHIRVPVDAKSLPGADFCNQCGECIDVCPTQALYRDRRGAVRLRQELCVSCLSCVGFCPYLVMYWHPNEAVPFKCISCGVCARECPSQALEILDVEEPLLPVQ
jgi:Fe-S-cluster-containing dehydrogenase component